MLSRTDARRTAAALLYRFGEVAIAAAVLRAQEARAAGRHQSMVDWYQIAEAAASRVTTDGLAIIGTARQEPVRSPVLVLGALGAVDDRVRGLRAGGDDYLAKPFAMVELVARLEALLRRPGDSRETVLRVGPLELDLIER